MLMEPGATSDVNHQIEQEHRARRAPVALPGPKRLVELVAIERKVDRTRETPPEYRVVAGRVRRKQAIEALAEIAAAQTQRLPIGPASDRPDDDGQRDDHRKAARADGRHRRRRLSTVRLAV